MNSPTKSPQAPAGAGAPRKTVGRTVLIVVCVAAALVWLTRVGLHAYRYENTDDAYLTGHLYQISPQVGGQVDAVLVDDNQNVKAGDVLARLRPLEFELAVQKARNQLVQAEANEAEARAAVAQADTRIVEAQARATQAEAQLGQTGAALKLADLNLTRGEQLFSVGGAVAQSDLDAIRSAASTTKAAHIANEANVSAARAAIDSARSVRASAEVQTGAAAASVGIARTALADAERVFSYVNLVAPADGRVGNKNVERGNRVATGQTLMVLVSPEAWIIANFKETQLTRMSPGQDVDVTLDVLPGRKLHGKVESLAPASGAQFALLPPDNATGNFNKVVQRVPVKIVLDEAELKAIGPSLRLGLSVVVDVRVR